MQISSELVTIAGEEVTQTNQVRFLGSIIHNYGEIEEGVTNRIKVGRFKCRSTSRVLCGK